MLTSVCVRWHAGRASWRPAAELFEAAAFEVATIDSDTTARACRVGPVTANICIARPS